jgi:cell wall-associated NlpC family hydrolase
MGPGGSGLRRRLVPLVIIAPLALSLAQAPAASAAGANIGLTAGEDGTGMPPLPSTSPAVGQTGGDSFKWSDVGGPYAWVRPAANWVGKQHRWMRDFHANPNGTYPFRPSRPETRKYFARAIVRALAPSEDPDPSISFSDLDDSSRFFPFANVAVKLGWLTTGRGRSFLPGRPVTTAIVHRAFVRALGLRSTAAEIDALHTRDGFEFTTPRNLGVVMLGYRLGLRHNNKADESQDVGPRDRLNRAQVAYSLYKATTLESWVVPWLEDQYAGMELPNMGRARRRIVQWGLRYVGYPYVWGGEWGLESPEPAGLGGQPIPGFDCSGLTWWLMRKNDEAYWHVAPPRPYAGWTLPQRVSTYMARKARTRLKFDELLPGDLMFYDGDDNGSVDHVDVFVGNGWAIDSSSSVGGVTFMWVGDGWYRDHFTWGRRIIPRR